MTHRDFPKNRARDAATSGRMSQGDESVAVRNIPDEILEAADDGRLVDLAMYRALQGPVAPIVHDDSPPIDAPAREKAEGQISELHTKLSEAESILAWLNGFVGEGSLGAAAVGSTAIKLGEAREQFAAIRQAIRDMERGS